MHLRAAVIGIAAGLLLAGAPLAAHALAAEPPLDLAGAYVLDTVGALDGREAEVEAALDGLYERTQTALFVVVVSTFESPSDNVAWANETAIASGLGDADVLLAIAVDDRNYAWSVAETHPLTDTELATVSEESLIPALRGDDYVGGIVASADQLGDILSEPVPSPPSDTPSGDGLPVVPIIGGVALVGVGAFVVTRIVRKKRGSGATSATGSDESRAGGLLVALDDAVRESEQEVGFAEAQFGTAAVATFAAAVAEAKGKLHEAFAIRQRLDDATPESPAEAAQLTARIISLCESAQATLETHEDEFAQLRQLETSAPQALETITAQHGTLADRIATAQTQLAELTSRFGAAAIDAVDDNPAQAAQLSTFAHERIGAASAALGESDNSAAALAVRDAQRAVGQAGELLDAVATLQSELPKTVERLAAARAALGATIQQAHALPTDPALAAAIASAERVVPALAGEDPAGALLDVEHAAAGLDTALAASRDAEARAAASREHYERVRMSALERIRQAEGYITTRRGGIGSAARTRLAEATRLLDEASRQFASDPEAAAATALRANDHAEQAFRLARSDVESFGQYGSSAGGGVFSGGVFSGGGSGAIPSIVLGGLGGARTTRAPSTPSIGRSAGRRPSFSSGSSRSRSSSGRRRGSGGRF